MQKHISYFFSSDTAAGALNVSADNSSFSVNLQSPLFIPPNAKCAELSVQQANIWNTTPNFGPLLNNNEFTFTTTVAPAGTYTITLPTGLYSLQGFSSFIATQLINIGLPGTLFTFSGNGATQQSIITIATIGDSVDMTASNSVSSVLGFNHITITAAVANESFYSNNVAEFNRVNSYLIRSDMTVGGIPINGNSGGVIASVPISAPPGSEIIYQPSIMIPIPCDELIGYRKLNINFALLDQQLRAAGTPGQPWSVVIIISFYV